MIRHFTALLLATAISACRPAATATAPTASSRGASDESLDGRPVVRNHEAKPGDVTTCPYSGRKFVVEADSPRFEYEGKNYVLCSDKARDAVAADPAKYITPDM